MGLDSLKVWEYFSRNQFTARSKWPGFFIYHYQRRVRLRGMVSNYLDILRVVIQSKCFGSVRKFSTFVKIHISMTRQETIEKLEARYVELWNEGFRPTRIFRTIAEETSYSIHTLQKMLDVRKLKKELTE